MDMYVQVRYASTEYIWGGGVLHVDTSPAEAVLSKIYSSRDPLQ
jgi:hypothetical protein